MEEGDIAESITSRRKIQLIVEEWDAIKPIVNNGATIPIDARRDGTSGVPLCVAPAVAAVGKREKQNQEKARVS
jgi:hypothetical protein